LIVNLFAVEGGFHFKHSLLGWLKNCIKPTEDGHGKDHIAVLSATVDITEHIVSDVPEEVCKTVQLSLIHEILLRNQTAKEVSVMSWARWLLSPVPIWSARSSRNTFKMNTSVSHSMILVRSADSPAIGVFVGEIVGFLATSVPHRVTN
jgi:hypothetical protein